MNYILTILKDYLKEHFNLRLYVSTILFTSVLLYFNFKYDIEDGYIDSFYKTPIHSILFFFYHYIPYLIVLVFVSLFTENKDFFKNKRFWLISILGFIFLALNRGFYYHIDIIKEISPVLSSRYIWKISKEWIALITIVLPFYLLYKLVLKNELQHFYGIRIKGVHLKPYFWMLLMMIPLVAWASYQPDFLDNYPVYKRSTGSLIIKYFDFSKYTVVGIYELSYAFGYFIVELIFRGYLIFALVKYLGKDVVLPMAVTYTVLHFGKPVGEAISSFFGGYILGVIALKTENIYGGIMIHMGIALLMELFAFWQLSM